MDQKIASYADLVPTEKYLPQIGIEHVWIPEADMAAMRTLAHLIEGIFFTSPRRRRRIRIVEDGSGPARSLLLIGEMLKTLSTARLPISVTGYELATQYVKDGQRLLREAGLSGIQLVEADVLKLKPEPNVARRPDIIYLTGFYHHVPIGRARQRYAKRLLQRLAPGGYVVLVDEILAPYTTEPERQLRAIIWYAYVIFTALRNGFHGTAYEEASILLDELAMVNAGSGVKTEAQIQLVLSRVEAICMAALKSWQAESISLASETHELLKAMRRFEPTGDLRLDASHEDYKIGKRPQIAELIAAGFDYISDETYGPVNTIGGLGVFVAQKPI